jgi:hypothetical protein
MTDQWLPLHVCPTEDSLHIKADHYTAGVRAFLLMPQLLRRTVDPVWLDRRDSGQPDYSYQADPCRHCANKACDRHLIHAHACTKSSKSKLRDRHELVKKARALTAADAGYGDIKVEPRTSNLDQRRADIFFVDARGMKTFHHYTDDVVSHPHSPAHHLGERSDPYHAMGKSETKKAGSYRTQLLQAKSHPAVTAGVRVIIYRTCAFTSLGELGKGTVKFVNGAAGFLKKRLVDEHERRPPLDGQTPQQHSAKLRFLTRARLQAAILAGNGLIAVTAGL